jgi:hypothetical protein
MVVIAVTSAMAQPDVIMVSGTIQAVDATAGRFTLRSPEGTLTELPAPAALLRRLQTGEVVEVMIAGPNAMIIRTQAETSPPAVQETLAPPLQDPSEERRPPPATRRDGQ